MGRTHILAAIAPSQNNVTLTLTANRTIYSCACAAVAHRGKIAAGDEQGVVVCAPDGALPGGHARHWQRARGIRQRMQLIAVDLYGSARKLRPAAASVSPRWR